MLPDTLIPPAFLDDFDLLEEEWGELGDAETTCNFIQDPIDSPAIELGGEDAKQHMEDSCVPRCDGAGYRFSRRRSLGELER